MSYILEALKKAESERERGAVPGLSSTQTNTTTYIRYRNGSTPWWLVVLALGAVMAGVAGLWAWRQTVPEAAVVTPVSQALAPVPAPAPAPAPVPAAPPVVAAAAVAVTPPVPSAAVPIVAAPAFAAPVPAAKAVASASPAPRVAASGIPLYSELPDSLRRQVPPLSISGAINSDAPAEWTLIVNDQVLGKGSTVAPDLRLEDISATSATFNFKGQRFRIEH